MGNIDNDDDNNTGFKVTKINNNKSFDIDYNIKGLTINSGRIQRKIVYIDLYFEPRVHNWTHVTTEQTTWPPPYPATNSLPRFTRYPPRHNSIQYENEPSLDTLKPSNMTDVSSALYKYNDTTKQYEAVNLSNQPIHQYREDLALQTQKNQNQSEWPKFNVWFNLLNGSYKIKNYYTYNHGGGDGKKTYYFESIPLIVNYSGWNGSVYYMQDAYSVLSTEFNNENVNIDITYNFQVTQTQTQ